MVSARCDEGGQAQSADTGTPLQGPAGAGTFKDATRTITVAGDGTGVYDGPGLHVAVLADGTGVYDDGTTRYSVRPGGEGTYTSRGRRLTVKPDGSGSYQDDEIRFWAGPDGSGGYDDDETRVSVDASGEVDARGDEAEVEVVTELLSEGLPLFPPVPRIARVLPSGTRCGTIVRLDASVLFGFDDATLQPQSQDLLARVATLLVTLDAKAAVNGHTDGVGSAEYNTELSRRRAVAVRDELVRLGVSAPLLEAHGLGETRPVRPETLPDGGDDGSARQLNRRVELVLLEP